MLLIIFKNNKNLFSLILFVLVLFCFPFFAFSESSETIHQQIQTLKNEKKYSEATPLLEKLVFSQAENIDWKVELCHLYRWTKATQKSSNCFEEVLRKMPDHPDAWMGKAYLARARGNLSQGKSFALKVLAKNPQNKDAVQFLAEVKKTEAKKARAAKALQTAASNPKIATDSQSAEYQQIQSLKNEKKFSEAIPLLQKLSAEKPDNLDWKIELCNLYRWSQNYPEASHCYDEVLAKKQNHPDAWMGKAYLASRLDNRVEIRNWTQKALAANSSNKEALLLLANLERREKNTEKSKNLYQEVLKQDPNNQEAQAGAKGESFIKDPNTAVNRTHFDILSGSQTRWRVDVGGVGMKFNFFPSASGAFFQLYYKNPKKYFLLGRFDYLNKFGEKNYSYTVGGGYYVHPRIIISDTIATSPTSDVLVRLQNIFEVSGIAPHGLNPYIRYNFSQYQLVKLHAVTTGVAWYFNQWGIFDINYVNIPTKTDVAAGWARDYSTSARLTFIPVEDRFKFYLNYVREQESFDAGNPVFPVGRFRSNHFGAGLEWVMIRNVGLRIDTDYEDRNNGQHVQTYNSSIFYQF